MHSLHTQIKLTIDLLGRGGGEGLGMQYAMNFIVKVVFKQLSLVLCENGLICLTNAKSWEINCLPPPPLKLPSLLTTVYFHKKCWKPGFICESHYLRSFHSVLLSLYLNATMHKPKSFMLPKRDVKVLLYSLHENAFCLIMKV